MNRPISEPGWPEHPERDREIWVRHVQGIYAIMRVLRARHPQLDIEACAGGGGRADLGVLRYADQIWDEYRLSMDGATRETYAHVRGVDAFDKIWRNLAAFTAMQRERQAMKPVVSLWFTAMRENLHELPALVELAHKAGIREVYLQRLVYFEEGLATSRQAFFRRSTPEELAIVLRSEQLCKEYGHHLQGSGLSHASREPRAQFRGTSLVRMPSSIHADLYYLKRQRTFLLLRAFRT